MRTESRPGPKKGEKNSGGPTRTCIGCLAKKNKFALRRVIVDVRGRVVFDPKQSGPGRGAYVCSDPACLTAALKRGRLDRAFRRKLVAAELTESGADETNR